MTPDTFLFNAGSLFFLAWIAIIAAISVVAFGRDLLPLSASADPVIDRRHADRPAHRIAP